MTRRQGETSYKETAFGVIPRSKLIPLEIEGIKRAWDFVLKTIRHDSVVTPDLLQKIHRIGFGWIFPEKGGKFRRIEVEISDHRPPKFYKISQLMTDFCRDLAERLRYLPTTNHPNFLVELVAVLTWAHHRFLWIHPFEDYNGRIGRLLLNMILLRLDLPPIEMKVETTSGRKTYIQALQAGDRGDLAVLEKLVASALEEAAQLLK